MRLFSVRLLGFICFALFLSPSCTDPVSTGSEQTDFSVDFEKFTLDNGLEVVFHVDRSDPVTAVAQTFHVGSAREKAGRTGFAHLFEHLLFLESENLGKGGLDKMSSRVGGSGANGSTSRDRTNYFQTVPNDALEKMLWAEADKLGYFINTVTDQVLAKEKQVVKNEKRQGVDNAPYGHTNYVIGKNLYPQDHPYNWQVIGSLEDLQNATLEDVKEFYRKWYVPNNATLVVAGDFDVKQAKTWVEKYFSEIPRGDAISDMETRPAELDATANLFYEDNFARVPELRITWPSVEMYHPDAYPLEVLAELLSVGKKAPFYQEIVADKQLASNVRMFSNNSELAGEFSIRIRAYEDTDLDAVAEAIDEAFAKFDQEGFKEADLNRIKAGMETRFYNGLSSVLGKAFQLAQYNIFAGDPGFIKEDINNILAVTKEDVLRVYKQYIKNQKFVATSFVPRGQAKLAMNGAQLAAVAEEQIIQGAEDEFILPKVSDYKKTASSFDRTVEPPYGTAPQAKTPEVWQDELANGLKVYGIKNAELPIVQFNLEIEGGLLLDDPNKVGVANLLATLMTKGTKSKTPEALEEAINELGASINLRAGNQSIIVSGNTLSRNYPATMKLVEEILLEPRWDVKEFELAKQSTLSQVIQQQGNPNNIATLQYNRLIYGEDHIFSKNILGDENTIPAIKLEDLQAYYETNFSPGISKLHIVGNIDQSTVMESLAGINTKWTNKEVTIPEYALPADVEQSQVYFYNVPNAKQSVIRFGYLALAENDPDFYPASVMNYILGGGGFASQLTQQLREGKGYTYGIGSSFRGSDMPGPFTISSGVRSNITYEAAALVKEILEKYPEEFSEQDLAVTKSFLLKSSARTFETLGAKLNMLQNISTYGWDANYNQQREQIVKDMTIDQIQQLARKYIDPNKMIYMVVGDADTQLERLKGLGFGDPILLNPPVQQ